MGAKYNIGKDNCRQLFAIVEMVTEGRWHQIYQKLGWQQPSGSKNFTCFNESAHGDRKDSNPSLSVSEKDGRWQCFACGAKGNFQSFWRDYIKGKLPNSDSYTDFVIDFFNLSASIKFDKQGATPGDTIRQDLRDLSETYKKLQEDYRISKGHPHILCQEHENIDREINTLDMEILNKAWENLKNSESARKYLQDTRNISLDVIEKYKIGLDGQGRFVFPQIDTSGNLRNIKLYNPFHGPNQLKWVYPYKGYDTLPSPMINFTYQKIYLFEGEPDMYCAIGCGIEGAGTFGSASNVNLSKMFTPEEMDNIFKGKEIVICYDADPAGIVASKKIATQLYPYAKQIKIINLDKSEVNPYGLDPANINDEGKRNEKDFTDYMRKNGPWGQALQRFRELESETTVYVENVDRASKIRYKVTLQEARHPKYYSPDGNIELEVVGAVSDFNCDAYMYATSVSVDCPAMCDVEKADGKCKSCGMYNNPKFGSSNPLVFNFIRESTRENFNDPLCIKVDDHNILGLIQVTELQKMAQLRRIIKIREYCKNVNIVEIKREKMVKVRLTKDPSEYSDSNDQGGTSDINMEVYMIGERDILPGRSYKFLGVHTTAWDGQYAVLVMHSAEPIMNSIESFKVNQDIHSMLKVFEPKEGESIKDCLLRRYKAFGNAAGITGRELMFSICDMAFFSATEINNKKLLPEVHKGWVEALIVGQTRCAKTVVAKFLHRHYKIGEYIAGSGAVTRSGLIGGVKPYEGRRNIAWGKIPMNDGGIILIDEFSHINLETLDSMTDMRSSGIADINTIVSGKASARTRKLMMSNARVPIDVNSNDAYQAYGIDIIHKLCFKPEIVSRFDIAFYVTQDDVNVNMFAASYDQITTEFTEYQCSRLIMWAHSRKPDHIKSEDGVESFINECQINLLKKYHPSTQLVNQEMRAKLVRMAVSVAAQVHSTCPDDWDCILVKKEHVEYVVWLLDTLYSHKNMGMDEYSRIKRMSEELGDMRFMMNISKYVDLSLLLRFDEANDGEFMSIFYDYLQRVVTGEMFIVDALDDSVKTKKYNSMTSRDVLQKLIGIMISRNCLARTRRGKLRKTQVFSAWLTERLKSGRLAEQSDILETTQTERAVAVIKEAENNMASLSGSAVGIRNFMEFTAG